MTGAAQPAYNGRDPYLRSIVMGLNFAGIYTTTPGIAQLLAVPKEIERLPQRLHRAVLGAEATPTGAHNGSPGGLWPKMQQGARAWCDSTARVAAVSVVTVAALGTLGPVCVGAVALQGRLAVGTGGAPQPGGRMPRETLTAALGTYGILGLVEALSAGLGRRGTRLRQHPDASPVARGVGLLVESVGFGAALVMALALWVPRVVVALMQVSICITVGALVATAGALHGALRGPVGGVGRAAYTRTLAAAYDGVQALRGGAQTPATASGVPPLPAAGEPAPGNPPEASASPQREARLEELDDVSSATPGTPPPCLGAAPSLAA